MPGYIGGDFEGAAGGKACHSRWVQDAAGLGDRGEFSVFYQKPSFFCSFCWFAGQKNQPGFVEGKADRTVTCNKCTEFD